MMIFHHQFFIIKSETSNIDVVFHNHPLCLVQALIADLTLGHDAPTTFPLPLPLSSVSRATIPDLWGMRTWGVMVGALLHLK